MSTPTRSEGALYPQGHDDVHRRTVGERRDRSCGGQDWRQRSHIRAMDELGSSETRHEEHSLHERRRASTGHSLFVGTGLGHFGMLFGKSLSRNSTVHVNPEDPSSQVQFCVAEH